MAQDLFGEEKVADILNKTSTSVFGYLKNSFSSLLESVITFIVSLVIIFFILFFMFTSSEEAKKTVKEYLPFKKRNVEKLIKKFEDVTYSTIVGSGLIALLQGILVSVGFLIFGIKGVLVWGLIAAILSFLPALGAPLVYVPAGLILVLQGDYFSGIGILIWGVVLVSSVDNILRPIVGKELAKIHPLITLIGVIVGIQYFSIVGVVIGPLLLSYLFLLLKIYKEEHID
jgi:predicted PurR-regulated permease PerM